MKQRDIKFVTGNRDKSWERNNFKRRQKHWKTIKTRRSIRDINNQRKYTKRWMHISWMEKVDL